MNDENTIRQTVDVFYESTDYRCTRPATRIQRHYELERFCKTKEGFGGTYGDLPITYLTYEFVDAIIADKLDRPGACRALIWSLRALVKFANKTGIKIPDPTRDIVLPPLNPFGFRAWTEDDIALFEATYPIGTQERLAFMLALYTALRREDLRVLGPQHVRGGKIYVCPEKTRTTSGVFLVLPMHPALADVLALVPEGQSAFLQSPRKRGPFTAIDLSIWFINACRAAGLPKGLSLHGLRKAACRRLAEAGCTTFEIMAVSGHRTMRNVEIYTRTVSWEKLARRAISKVALVFPCDASGSLRLSIEDSRIEEDNNSLLEA